ncbi:TRAP transporter substrate-binding protein DctP [Alteribacillus sp. JSM 102045]|uniref:TRAP transporter substrate-binding protein DctP n=1 Tax=Alteribacillus sp. JSM 102045 TaxID=1562101 RepID=UPI0035BF8DC4
MSVKKVLSLVIYSFTFLLFVTGCGGESASSSGAQDDGNNNEVYTLNLATSLDETQVQMAGVPIFEEKVESYSDGRIEINYIGGPEAISGMKQGEAIRSGAIDISWTYSSYYAELIPEVLVTNFTELSYEEELERGSFEYLNELHADMNALILGRTLPSQYRLYLTEEVESAEDLAGLRIRGTSTYVPTLESFGTEAISLESGEVYTALERGMIDGVAYNEFGITDISAEELLEYQVSPSFNTLDGVILMNLDAFEQLPGDLQDVLYTAAIETYYETEEETNDFIEDEKEVLKEAGVEEIKLTNETEFLETSLEASWEWLSERVEDPETLAEYFRE